MVQAQFCGLVRHCLIISKRRGHWPLILASSFNNNNMFVIIRASSCLLSFLYNRFKLTSLPIDSTICDDPPPAVRTVQVARVYYIMTCEGKLQLRLCRIPSLLHRGLDFKDIIHRMPESALFFSHLEQGRRFLLQDIN